MITIMLLIQLFLSLFIPSHSLHTMYRQVNAEQSSLIITLPANPSTGYQWTVLHYNKLLLRLVAKQYIAPQTNLIGAKGQMSFIFEPQKGIHYPKITRMLFYYAQPWEPKKGLFKTVIIQFMPKNDDTIGMN